jgi:hypothetical protein
MNDIQTTVLAKVVGDKEAKAARSRVLPGEYSVDFTVRLHGTAKVGEDYERPATTSIPWLEVTTLYREVFRKAIDSLVAQIDAGGSVTRDDLTSMATAGVLTTDVLVDCIKTALSNGSSAVGTIEDRVKEVEAGVEALKKDLVAKTPPQSVPGRVSLSVETELLGIPQGVTADQIAVALNPQVIPQNA